MSKLFLKILDTCEFQKKISIITVENWTFQKLQIVNNSIQSKRMPKQTVPTQQISQICNFNLKTHSPKDLIF
jgi:hypothetical protein